MSIAQEIVCPDCGGVAHLVTPIGPEDVIEVGDVLAYACEDCLSRWDIVVEEDDLSPDDGVTPV